MSSSNESNAEHSDGNGLNAEDLAPIAAVDGLGALTPEQVASVDTHQVEAFEAAAGALFTAFALERRGLQQMPSVVLDRIQAGAESHFSGAASGNLVRPASESLGPRPLRSEDSGSAEVGASQVSGKGWQFGPVAAIAGWAAAAALLAGLLSTMGRMSDLEGGQLETEPKKDLVRFQLTAADVVQLAWQPLGPKPAVKGEVIWSDDRNEGFMRIKGLPVNDPSKSQYQLWIFRGNDPAAEPHPVDGGVFNVASGGEVIVPIEAKLAVGHAGIFAVTVEKPGGVVVSGRDQIVALAQRAS